MDGHDYEYAVARYLKSIGYTGTKVTKGSGDFGVDVLANKGGHKYAVQCKYYSSPVGVAAVQEAVAGKVYYGCDRAMVVTNSTFTKAAWELARVNDVVLLEGVRASGTRPKCASKLKVILILAYLFVAAAAMSAAFEASQGLSFWQAAYNIIPMIVVLAAPFWIPFVFKRLVSLIRAALAKRKVEKATPAAQAPVTVPAAPQQTINEATLASYLELDYGQQAQWIAHELSGSDHISVSVIQRRCKFGFARASQLMDVLTRAGLVYMRGSGQYEWAEKAKSPSHKA